MTVDLLWSVFVSALLDHGSQALSQNGQGAREPSLTPLFRSGSGIVIFCRDSKAVCRGGGVCGLENSHALATKHCVCWGDTELPRNTVCNIAFLSIVLRGTRSGNILLITSSPLSRPVSTGLVFLHSTIARTWTVELQSGHWLCPRGLQVQGQTDGPHNLELLCPRLLGLMCQT